MITRIALLFGIFTAMGFGGYMTAHSKMQHGPASHGNQQHEHPITLAIESAKELQLNTTQVARLEGLRDQMMKELEPTHAKLRDIHERARKAHEANDQRAIEQIEKEVKTLEGTAMPVLHRYAQEAAKILSPQQQQKLMQMLHTRMANQGSQDFMLMHLMQLRDQLGITPKQFTELQYLQADFIRAFAPLREQLEELHLEIKDSGKAPSKEMLDRAASLQKQVKEMQSLFSNRALQEVLRPEQREKLSQMPKGGDHSGGNHGPGGHGGGQHGSGHGGGHTTGG